VPTACVVRGPAAPSYRELLERSGVAGSPENRGGGRTRPGAGHATEPVRAAPPSSSFLRRPTSIDDAIQEAAGQGARANWHRRARLICPVFSITCLIAAEVTSFSPQNCAFRFFAELRDPEKLGWYDRRKRHSSNFHRLIDRHSLVYRRATRRCFQCCAVQCLRTHHKPTKKCRNLPGTIPTARAPDSSGSDSVRNGKPCSSKKLTSKSHVRCFSNNMLYPKEDKENKILMYACRNCDYKQHADSKCIYVNKIMHEIE
jgi:hypothetical protein